MLAFLLPWKDTQISTKAELRRKVATVVSGLDRPTQTHSVFIGKFRVPGYIDGDVIRCLQTGDVIARKLKRGWSETVKAVTIQRGRWDHVRPINSVAVEVKLSKGEFY